jgi:hypothetical protein
MKRKLLKSTAPNKIKKALTRKLMEQLRLIINEDNNIIIRENELEAI